MTIQFITSNYALVLSNGIATETLTMDFGKDMAVDKTNPTLSAILHLVELHVEKEMYKPGYIKAKIQVIPDSTKEGNTVDINALRALLLGRKVSLTETYHYLTKTPYIDEETGDPKTRSEDSGLITKDIAKEHIVCKLEPEYSKSSESTSVYVWLHIYSPEKQLSFRKYNRCYVAKKLGEDIFAELTKNNKTDDKSITPLFPIIQNPQHLMIKEKEEFIQPYLVQYDETPLDFLNRTANRCGEFLFFEGGKWRLGASAEGTNKEIMGETYPSDVIDKIYEYDCLTYQCSDLSEESFLMAGDYTGQNPTSIPVEPKQPAADAKVEDKEKYNKELKAWQAYNAGVLSYTGPANENVASYKEKVASSSDTFTDNYKLNTPSFWIENISSWLKEENVMDICGSLAADLVKNGIDTAIHYKEDANEFNEAHIEPYADKTVQIEGAKGKRKVTPYTNISAVENNFTDKFYSCVLQHEKEAENGAIHMELGTGYGAFPLGGVYNLTTADTNKYIITRISLSVVTKEDNKQTFKAAVDALPIIKVGNDMQPYPAPLKEGGNRKAEPQTAIVTSTDDPYKLGRVQICYPWQVQKKGEPTSPWIRIAAPFTSKGAAIKFMPQEGDEIMVGYEYGDIERPFMIGSLQSKTNNGDKNKYIIKSPNGHYIKFNNPDNAKDFITSFSPGFNLAQSYIPGLQSLGEDWKGGKEWAGGITMGDAYGFYKISMSTDKRSVSIASAMGNVSINALTGITISAPSGNVKIVGKNVEISAGNNLTIKSGTNINHQPTPSFLKSLGGHVASSFISSFTEDLNKLKIIDLSMVRTIAEAIVKPIGGNMLIKSNRFLRLEAGKGETKMTKPTPVKLQSTKDKEAATKSTKTFIGIYVHDLLVNANKFMTSYTVTYSDAVKNIGEFFTNFDTKIDEMQNIVNSDPNTLTYDNQPFSEKIATKIPTKEAILDIILDETKSQEEACNEACQDLIKFSHTKEFFYKKDALCATIITLAKFFHTKKLTIDSSKVNDGNKYDMKDSFNFSGHDKEIPGVTDYNSYKTQIENTLTDTFSKTNLDKFKADFIKNIKPYATANKDMSNYLKEKKREIMYDTLMALEKKGLLLIVNNQSNWMTKAGAFLDAEKDDIDLTKKDDICKDAEKWEKFLDAVQICTKEEYEAAKNPLKTALKTAAINQAANLIDWKNIMAIHDLRSVYPDGATGKILLSDVEEYTTSFNEKQLETKENKPAESYMKVLLDL